MKQLSAAERIFRELIRLIIRGHYLPGEALRQDHLAEAFGSSHVPVREALLRLVAIGLAVSKPHHGVRVSSLDPYAQRELKVMRQALEPLAIYHSVPYLTVQQVSDAEMLRQACDKAENIYEWEEANRTFHAKLYEACAMPRLREEVSNLQLMAARYILVDYKDRWRPVSDRDHYAMMQAVRKKDAKMAKSVVERHLSRMG